MRVLGFMTGTSLDAVDMAILDTDGETIDGFGPAGEAPLAEPLRERVLHAIAAGRSWPRGAPEPNLFADVDVGVADAHFDAAQAFLTRNDLEWSDLDLIGMHGQTVLHEAPIASRLGRTRQLGDAQRLADRAGIPVAYGFRDADVAAGGHGAPLAPVYHAARLAHAGLRPPIAVLNVGGVANLTTIGRDGALAALDTGPGNGLLDLWAERHGRGRFDAGGELASAGRIDPQRLARMLSHEYFARPAPKSLDRYDFGLEGIDGLDAADGAATLVAFTAEAVALAIRNAAGGSALLVCGGGRRNLALLRELSLRCARPVITAEAIGWRGDAIEAELFAYLAARTYRGLPITYPTTTGAPRALAGGRVATPRGVVT